ncbi:hypothetical protein [Leptospira adleri]|uniref:Uncharacterized protein n=1 Tax=Leptospira adleri TaxID=2023186 RepID=A0A2M9YIN1_9LEPT|nr:hypothetical protein [Leptospira adleri]PJZ51370.1 hypothetical protein CH380_20435 [Leptospira adleri]PJZ60432.1 hypothetical protein CH376_18440 [Leptospira adleri]
MLRNFFVPVLATAAWITASEFFRNEILFKSYWVLHYESKGLRFPSEPINGAVWILWSFFLAVVLYILSRKFTLTQTFLFGWFVGFVLMWIVVWNLGMLPSGLLIYAVPLSLLEIFLGSIIVKRLSKD